MGFRIFAAGTDNFHYERNGCIDGSGFEMMKLISTLQTMELSKLGVVGAGMDIVNPGITDLMYTMASMEFLHSLKNAVSFLAMNATEGWIHVTTTKKNLVWVNTMANGTYNFRPGNSPGAEFVKAIGKALKETDMDNFGVLLQLSIVLTKYSQKLSDPSKPMLTISLTK